MKSWTPIVIFFVGAIMLLIGIGIGANDNSRIADEARERRLKTLEQRLDALELKEPPTCWQIHPEKFTIDIYPSPNLGAGPKVRKP